MEIPYNRARGNFLRNKWFIMPLPLYAYVWLHGSATNHITNQVSLIFNVGGGGGGIQSILIQYNISMEPIWLSISNVNKVDEEVVWVVLRKYTRLFYHCLLTKLLLSFFPSGLISRIAVNYWYGIAARELYNQNSVLSNTKKVYCE